MPLTSAGIQIGAWKRVPPSFVGKDLDTIKMDLTIENPDIKRKARYLKEEIAKEDEYILLWDEDDKGSCLVPRAYPRIVDGDRGVYEFEKVSWPKDRIKLRPKQVEAYAALSAPPDHHFGRMLVLGCGAGKTTISLKAGMKREVPILVVVDTNELADQWEERIIEFCGLERDQIGRFQGARKEWKGYPIVIAMAQTLMRKNWRQYKEDFRRYFGLVIYDEVHIMGAVQFSKCVPIFYGERWGLTATPVRADGMDMVFRYHIATTPCYVNVDQDLIPSFTYHKTGVVEPDIYVIGPKRWKNRWWSKDDLRKLSSEELYVIGKILGVPTSRIDVILRQLKGRASIPATLTLLSNNEDRNSQILRVVNGLHNQGRTTLVIGGRTDQLVWLHTHYKSLYGKKSGLCYGKVPKKDRYKQLHDYDVTFAAQNMLIKGFDRPAVDTLVVTMIDPLPCSLANTQQSVGRIQRPIEGKTAQVHYFLDENSEALRPTVYRLEGYIRKLFGTPEINTVKATTK